MATINLERVPSIPSGCWVSDAIVAAGCSWEETVALTPSRMAANLLRHAAYQTDLEPIESDRRIISATFEEVSQQSIGLMGSCGFTSSGEQVWQVEETIYFYCTSI